MTRPFDAARKGDAFWQASPPRQPWGVHAGFSKQNGWRFGRETFQQARRRSLTNPVRSRTTETGSYTNQP